MKKIILLLSSVLVVGLLAGCAQNVSPNTYGTGEVGVVSKVKKGVIISRREVAIDNNSGAGGLAGAAAGAAAGTMVGSNTATSVVGAVGGAVVGGVAGSVIDKGIHQKKGYEYIIQLDKGQAIAVVQAQEVQFAVKQHVLVIYGAMTRIVADDTNA